MLTPRPPNSNQLQISLQSPHAKNETKPTKSRQGARTAPTQPETPENRQSRPSASLASTGKTDAVRSSLNQVERIHYTNQQGRVNRYVQRRGGARPCTWSSGCRLKSMPADYPRPYRIRHLPRHPSDAPRFRRGKKRRERPGR